MLLEHRPCRQFGPELTCAMSSIVGVEVGVGRLVEEMIRYHSGPWVRYADITLWRSEALVEKKQDTYIAFSALALTEARTLL